MRRQVDVGKPVATHTRSTGSPPRARRERARVGAGTRCTVGSMSPRATKKLIDARITAPTCAATSRRPRSFIAIITFRCGPS